MVQSSPCCCFQMRAMSYALFISVAQSQPRSSNLTQDEGWTAKVAVLMIVSEVVVSEGRQSHTVQKVCHRFLILFIGSETISKASGNFTRAWLCFRKITTFGDDLLLVDVVCFVHDGIIAQIPGNLNPCCDTLQTGFFACQFYSPKS